MGKIVFRSLLLAIIVVIYGYFVISAIAGVLVPGPGEIPEPQRIGLILEAGGKWILTSVVMLAAIDYLIGGIYDHKQRTGRR